jgi:hypothetical protein
MKSRRKIDVGDDRKMAKIVVKIVISMYCISLYCRNSVIIKDFDPVELKNN